MRIPCGYKWFNDQGGVQFIDNKPVPICGDTIMWFERMRVLAKNEKMAYERMTNKLERKYPQYKGFFGFYG